MSTMAVTLVRLILGVLGILLMAVGLLIIAAGGEAMTAGVAPLIIGGGLLIAVVLERQRYRSETAERASAPPGPGGGEPDPLPVRFGPTGERFVDPTTGSVMRVYLDPKTGERRYRSEGDVAAGMRP